MLASGTDASCSVVTQHHHSGTPRPSGGVHPITPSGARVCRLFAPPRQAGLAVRHLRTRARARGTQAPFGAYRRNAEARGACWRTRAYVCEPSAQDEQPTTQPDATRARASVRRRNAMWLLAHAHTCVSSSSLRRVPVSHACTCHISRCLRSDLSRAHAYTWGPGLTCARATLARLAPRGTCREHRASVLPDLLQNSVARGDTERDGERLQTPKVEEIPDIPRRDDMRRGDGDGITKPLHCLFA